MRGKVFTGEKYTFILPNPDKPLGYGGNGKVYDVTIISPSTSGEYVAKFFWCARKDKRKYIRYTRFQREADQIQNISILGIIPILDKCCPTKWKGRFSAWYLMPKAYEYNASQRTTISLLQDMRDVALTLLALHIKELAHRDIKPDNLMLYKNRLCLIDFGLLWGSNLERLTTDNERVGPYRILPPELEVISPKEYVDFRKSDVYLFAKVLWIYITGKEEGFKGPYRRDREMIYLNRTRLIPTYEPLHQLLEQATYDDYSKRIDIERCVQYITLQIDIIKHAESSDPNWKRIIDQNVYSENTKRLIAYNEPAIKEYTDENIIDELIDAVINCSEARIKIIGEEKETTISFVGFEKKTDREYVFLKEIGRSVIKYRAKVANVRYKTIGEELEIILADLPKESTNDREKRFAETITQPDMNYEWICLSVNETIVFKKRK